MLKNNLDERQEQTLLKIEHNSCWLAYWGLLIAIVVQIIAYGFDASRLAGEWMLFMVLSIYLSYACLKNGIWSRSLKPNAKTNLLVSMLAAVLFGVVSAVGVCSHFEAEPLDYLIVFVGCTLVTFVLCYLALAVTARAYKKEQAKLEAEDEEE